MIVARPTPYGVVLLMHAWTMLECCEDAETRQTLASLAQDLMNPTEGWAHLNGCICKRCQA